MKLEMRRFILFTANMSGMVAFYRDVLGLKLVVDEPGWKDFDAGGCRIALHRGKSRPGTRAPKISFLVEDVAAARAALIARGARLGKLFTGAGPDRCDGKDPDGNAIALSNRP